MARRHGFAVGLSHRNSGDFSMTAEPRRKTWKREVAVAVLALYAGAYGWTLYALSWAPAENASQMVTMVNGAAPWVAALVGGAFGLDGYSKQIKRQDHGQ
ncbi:hypothetical protein [Roseinatronobacter sp. NSM]|uniref:hypothetical protein n=1 Tax=Roseinatronobacter sp. NSM TaxID=3457785 RepID=UPI00403669BD